MEDAANSCIMCKARCGESEFEDVTGNMLETIVKIKVLAEMPFMLEPGTLSNKNDVKICRVCKGLLEKIQDNLKHLKDRVARRRVNFARMQFRQSRNVSSMNCERDRDREVVDHHSSLSAEPNCDIDSSGSRDQSTSGLRQSSTESKESNSPCTVQSHLCDSDNTDREVRIRVPQSVNATFIVLESSVYPKESSNNSKLLQSLVEQDTKVLDVISSASYERPHHVNLEELIEVQKKSAMAKNNEVKRQTPIINVTSCDDNSSDSVKSFNGHCNLQHAGSFDISANHSLSNKRKRPLTAQSRSFDEDSRNKLARLEQLRTESRSLNTSPNPIQVDYRFIKLSPDVKALDLSLRTPGEFHPLCIDPAVTLAPINPNMLRALPLHHTKNNGSMDSLSSQRSLSIENGISVERQSTEESVFSALSEDAARDAVQSNAEQDGKYPCEICGKNFEKKSFWKRHMVWSHHDQAFTCTHCGVKFAERFSLQIHESHEHGVNKTVPVSVPEQILYHQSQMKENIQKPRKKIQYCAQCHEHFTSKYDLLRHRVMTGHMGGAGGVCLDREEEAVVSQSQKIKPRTAPSTLTPPKLQHWSSSPYDSPSRNLLTTPLIKSKGVSLDTGLAQAQRIPEVEIMVVEDVKDVAGFKSLQKALSMDPVLVRSQNDKVGDTLLPTQSCASDESRGAEKYIISKEGNHLRVLEGPVK